MFLENSLKEKLKSNYLTNEPDISEHIKFEYKIPKKDPRVLLSFGDNTLNLNNEYELTSGLKLRALDKKEWESLFSLKKLKNEYKRKTEIDFDYNYKKFSDDAILPNIIESKKYIKDFLNPDILELKQKKWDNSIDVNNKKKPELKQTLFEVKHGLRDFKVIPLKEKKIVEGCDSRNLLSIDGKIWDCSNQISEKKIKSLSTSNLFNANENSIKYWKDNVKNRILRNPFPISEQRKKVEVIRYFKPYKIPSQKSFDYYNLMKKAKELTLSDREKLEKEIKKNNPEIEKKYPEKFNALIFKEMSKKYESKYNELIGNLNREDIKKKQLIGKNFKWNDEDLINKIIVINSIKESNIFPKKTITKSFSQENIKKKILEPLVIKGKEIINEEEKIKDKKQEEYKIRKKKELLKIPKKKINNIIGRIDDSKYPISKEEYDKLLNASESSSNENDENNILNTSKIEKKELFIEAYEKIAKNEIEKQEKKNKEEKEKIIIKYHHPGTYREFIYEENDNNEIDEFGKSIKKEVKNFFWSCCLNTDKDSKGCQKTIIKKNKWLYE